ncbi:MAG: T9SS type A sorting domain-containing protein [Ignavibacteria bacterium]|nr:T9SS type A sorting domain-containing protein [Ignavibacteria bacterium]
MVRPQHISVCALLLFAVLCFDTSKSLAGKQNTVSVTLNKPDNSSYTPTMRIDTASVARALYNINYRKIEGSPEQVARVFIQENSDLLKISGGPSTLETERIQTTPGGSHVRFTQMYHRIPVFRGDVVVSTNENNEVRMLINNFKSDIDLEVTTPSISANAAIQIARQSLGIKGPSIGKEDGSRLMVYRTKGSQYHLAYRVTMTSEEPAGDWEVFVDALSGNVLNVDDLFVTHRGDGGDQGSGYVFQPDPLSEARQLYNAIGFVDGNDADTDSLTHHRSLVVLDSLTFEDGVYKLKGPYCNVTDIESPPDPPFYGAVTSDGFQYTRSQQEFEAVNVYYHIMNSYRHILDLGFSSPSLEQIRLDPHGYQGLDNSHYSPTGNWISWGEGGVDDAEDADVILHEYGHAIQYNIVSTWGGGESGALGEGFGDYWAGSYTRSLGQWTSRDDQYNWVFTWDGHNPFWPGRILNDARTYPFGSLPIHTAGQIWSAALMGIWDDLGREVADRLVLKSHYYLGSGATGPDAAHAIVQADWDLYGGTHVQTLVHWLGSVKHFINPAAYVPIIVHTPLTGNQTHAGPFPIIATIASQQGLDEQSLKVIWGRGDSFTDTTLMVRTQSPNEFIASILGSGEPDTIRYYIAATDSFGAVATSPIGAPIQFYSFQAGSTISGAETEPSSVPEDFSLSQNYPNPFNPTTSIQYNLPISASVTLRVYNILGQEIATLVNDKQEAGRYTIAWNGTSNQGAHVGSGTYLYRLEASNSHTMGNFVKQKRMVLVK